MQCQATAVGSMSNGAWARLMLIDFSHDLRRLFKPVVDQVIGLLRCQIEVAVSHDLRENLNVWFFRTLLLFF